MPESSSKMIDGSLTLRQSTSNAYAAMTTPENARMIRLGSMGLRSRRLGNRAPCPDERKDAISVAGRATVARMPSGEGA